MRGPLRGYFLDTVSARCFRECPLVDAPRARRLVNQAIEDPQATFKTGEAAWWSVLPDLWSEALFRRDAGGGGSAAEPAVRDAQGLQTEPA